MCATALPPGKHGQVDGATAGGQELADEWEPGPAPSGSRENAAPARPGAAFAATTHFPWGKASRSKWEMQPLRIKSLFQSWRKVHGEEKVLAARIPARHQQTVAHCSTKKSLFLPKNFKLSRYPTASPGAGAAESAPALLSHQGHLSR